MININNIQTLTDQQYVVAVRKEIREGLSGRIGEYWKKTVTRRIERVKQKVEAGEFYRDASGLWRPLDPKQHGSGVVQLDDLVRIEYLGYPVDWPTTMKYWSER
jgi:hypothetical protein